MQSQDSQRPSAQAGKNTMRLGPGKWIEKLLDGAEVERIRKEHTLGAYGEEVTNALLRKAQQRVSSHSVAIGTTGRVKKTSSPEDMNPGTGVIVRLRGNMYGILTAGHVLNRPGNTSEKAGITIVARPQDWGYEGAMLRLVIPPRSFTVDGFHNTTEEGPDIAVFPLTQDEWGSLNSWGMVAYNLDKERWSIEERDVIRKIRPCAISIINGVRFEASRIMTDQTGGEKLMLAMTATNTQVQEVGERDGYDYVELPSEITEDSHSTKWTKETPRTVTEEIDSLYEEGVTRRVWGGVSGAGVWNVVLATNSSGLPNGRVFVELGGVCFYAQYRKGSIIGHGTKSIGKIAAKHIENEALRFHSQT